MSHYQAGFRQCLLLLLLLGGTKCLASEATATYLGNEGVLVSEGRTVIAFDPLFNKCDLIEKYGQNTLLMWQLTNRIGPIAPRDFVVVVHGNIVSLFFGFIFFC